MAKALLALAGFVSSLLPNSLKSVIYRLGPISFLIRTVLNNAAPHGLTEIEISAGPLRGARMQLDLQREKDYWLGTYELELQKAFREHIKAGMVIYDLGANIGYVSLLAARLAGVDGRVFAFEALPENLNRLRRNVELNPQLAPIGVFPNAVVGHSGKITFLVHSSGGMGKVEGSIGRDADYETKISVEGISLDDFVFIEGKQVPEIIKIDIEGGEGLALDGMQGVLKKFRPTLFLELHGKEAAKSVWETLNANNYSIHSLRRGYPLVSSYEELDWKSYLMANPL
jgi:FkbM family methyltransferase